MEKAPFWKQRYFSWKMKNLEKEIQHKKEELKAAEMSDADRIKLKIFAIKWWEPTAEMSSLKETISTGIGKNHHLMDKVKEAVQAHFDKDMEMVEEMTAEGGIYFSQKGAGHTYSQSNSAYMGKKEKKLWTLPGEQVHGEIDACPGPSSAITASFPAPSSTTSLEKVQKAAVGHTCNEPPTTSSEISNAFTGTLVADSSNQAIETESHERDGATLLNAETGSSHEEMSEIPVCDGGDIETTINVVSHDVLHSGEYRGMVVSNATGVERAESLRRVREIAGLTGSPATETTDAGPGSSSAPTTSSPTPRVSEAATNGETGANEQKKNQTTTEGQANCDTGACPGSFLTHTVSSLGPIQVSSQSPRQSATFTARAAATASTTSAAGNGNGRKRKAFDHSQSKMSDYFSSIPSSVSTDSPVLESNRSRRIAKRGGNHGRKTGIKSSKEVEPLGVMATGTGAPCGIVAGPSSSSTPTATSLVPTRVPTQLPRQAAAPAPAPARAVGKGRGQKRKAEDSRQRKMFDFLKTESTEKSQALPVKQPKNEYSEQAATTNAGLSRTATVRRDDEGQTPPGLRNIGNSCFANSAIQVANRMRKETKTENGELDTLLKQTFDEEPEMRSALPFFVALGSGGTCNYGDGDIHDATEYLEYILRRCEQDWPLIFAVEEVATCRSCSKVCALKERQETVLRIGNLAGQPKVYETYQKYISWFSKPELIQLSKEKRSCECPVPVNGLTHTVQEKPVITSALKHLLVSQENYEGGMRMDTRKIAPPGDQEMIFGTPFNPIAMIHYEAKYSNSGRRHYTAYIRDVGKWWYFDDENVKSAEPPGNMEGIVTVLFERCDEEAEALHISVMEPDATEASSSRGDVSTVVRPVSDTITQSTNGPDSSDVPAEKPLFGIFQRRTLLKKNPRHPEGSPEISFSRAEEKPVRPVSDIGAQSASGTESSTTLRHVKSSPPFCQSCGQHFPNADEWGKHLERDKKKKGRSECDNIQLKWSPYEAACIVNWINAVTRLRTKQAKKPLDATKLRNPAEFSRQVRNGKICRALFNALLGQKTRIPLDVRTDDMAEIFITTIRAAMPGVTWPIEKEDIIYGRAARMLSLIGIIWEHRHLFELRNVFGRDISKYAKTSAEYERGKDVFGRMKGHYGCEKRAAAEDENWLAGQYKTMWNKFMIMENRTTNLAENYHSTLGAQRPTLEALLKVINDMSFRAHTELKIDRSMHHFKKAADDYIESLTLNGRKTHCIVNDWKAGTKVGFVRLQCDSLEPVTLYIEGCLIHFFSLLELTNKKEGDWTQLFRTISGLDNETVNEMSTKEKAKLKSKERHDQDKPTAAEMVDVAVFILCEVLEDLDKRVVWMPLPKNKKK